MNEVIRRNDPYDLFSRFGSLFEGDPFFRSGSQTEWMPAVDIKESDDGYTFHMDVPGMKPADLDIELHEGVLSVRGSPLRVRIDVASH